MYSDRPIYATFYFSMTTKSDLAFLAFQNFWYEYFANCIVTRIDCKRISNTICENESNEWSWTYSGHSSESKSKPIGPRTLSISLKTWLQKENLSTRSVLIRNIPFNIFVCWPFVIENFVKFSPCLRFDFRKRRWWLHFTSPHIFHCLHIRVCYGP